MPNAIIKAVFLKEYERALKLKESLDDETLTLNDKYTLVKQVSTIFTKIGKLLTKIEPNNFDINHKIDGKKSLHDYKELTITHSKDLLNKQINIEKDLKNIETKKDILNLSKELQEIQ